MGVESLEVDQVNIRMVARTLPGKQFQVGRELRVRVAGGTARQGITASRRDFIRATNRGGERMTDQEPRRGSTD